jgi:hypothetical protein
VPVIVTIVSVDPRLEESVTVFPESGLPEEFFIVAVITEIDEPSATTEVGEAETVDWLAETVRAGSVVVLKLHGLVTAGEAPEDNKYPTMSSPVVDTVIFVS